MKQLSGLRLLMALLAFSLPVAVTALSNGVHAQDDAAPQESAVLSLTAHDIDWWEDKGDGLGTVLVLYLNADLSDELAELSNQHVGEKMTVLLNGKYLSEFLVQEQNMTGQLSLPITNEVRSDMRKELPPLPEKKPTTRFMKMR